MEDGKREFKSYGLSYEVKFIKVSCTEERKRKRLYRIPQCSDAGRLWSSFYPRYIDLHMLIGFG